MRQEALLAVRRRLGRKVAPSPRALPRQPRLPKSVAGAARKASLFSVLSDARYGLLAQIQPASNAMVFGSADPGGLVHEKSFL